MDIGDLEYVEAATGVSLDEDKPLSDIKRRTQESSSESRSSRAGASVDQPKRPEYDWFDFFLRAGVGVHQCERYAQNFNKDQMDESILPDITPEVLRTLGLKEGDILRVMKFLDGKFGRNSKHTSTGPLYILQITDEQQAKQMALLVACSLVLVGPCVITPARAAPRQPIKRAT